MDIKPITVFQILAFLLFSAIFCNAQEPILITQPINDNQLVTLAGNTRPEAIGANDRGPVSDSMLISHMLLQLQRSAQQEQALEALIDGMHNPASANYHHWLTPAQFGSQFGLSQHDLTAIAGWLSSQGFTVNSIYPSGMLIDFSGTAGQVRAAFHTEIHNLLVNGSPHIANMGDPRIPAALAPAISGIFSLHNFSPTPMYRLRDYTVPQGFFTSYLVGPGDVATIYGANPLFRNGIAGQGQTVAVVEDSDLFNPADWTAFRSTFGLSRFGGQLVTVNPPSSGQNNCADPGANFDDIEAAIDAEYAGATAPSATIEVAACAGSPTTFGGLIALENLLNSTPPSIISMSYGQCEAFNGAAANATFNAAFQQGVAEGVSIFVSSGDAGAAGCDRNSQFDFHGIGITGWGETPYNVSVGGTDFEDTYLNANTTYWNSQNTPFYESALSYIPEIPWNDTCASTLLANYYGYQQTYGNGGFCNSPNGSLFAGTAGGSGGPSGCATGSPGVNGVVSGSCRGYPKPSWQIGFPGVPRDGVRDIPDVSLFASNGFWGHYYLFCSSDFGPCTAPPSNWPGAGGTSFSSPIMAGIQALVNQVHGVQGNPNYAYYKLAALEYATGGLTNCNSSLGNGVAAGCTFYDITVGDMDVPCTIGVGSECYKPSGIIGVLSTSGFSYKPAYGANQGWDFATGIGAVNATNLVKNWGIVAP